MKTEKIVKIRYLIKYIIEKIQHLKLQVNHFKNLIIFINMVTGKRLEELKDKYQNTFEEFVIIRKILLKIF